ncbi:MAG TPA: hypothetical protein VGM29_02010 [Polyangiaceae bacterium]
MRGQLWSSCALLGGLALVPACDERRVPVGHDGGATEPSPNASILPAPLATGLESAPKEQDAGSRPLRDAGRNPDAGLDEPPPEPRALRVDQVLPSDSARDTAGLSLTARFRWTDAAPARLPELNTEAVQRARDETGFDLVIDVVGTRTRVALASHSFTLPAGSELRARDDLYGFALRWGNQTTYTMLAPGSLRAVLSERRADVVPLVHPKLKALPASNLQGLPTEQVELSTLTGRVVLEQGRAPQAQTPPTPNGASLCRLLLELVAAAPSTTVCRADLLPLRAEFVWPNGSHFVFEVTRIARRNDFDPSSLSLPPVGGEFRQSELPAPPPSLLLKEVELGALRNKPLQRNERVDSSAPKNGLLLSNHTDGLRYLLLDGVPVALVGVGAELLVPALKPGQYTAVTRDFFGNDDVPAKTVEVPSRLNIGDER